MQEHLVLKCSLAGETKGQRRLYVIFLLSSAAVPGLSGALSGPVCTRIINGIFGTALRWAGLKPTGHAAWSSWTHWGSRRCTKDTPPPPVYATQLQSLYAVILNEVILLAVLDRLDCSGWEWDCLAEDPRGCRQSYPQSFPAKTES